MSYLYLTRTVHMPLRADGCSVINAFGVTIATATNTFLASAMVDLINMAEPLAKAEENEHDEAEQRRASMILSARRNER